jgi:hypothetical protein
VLYAFKMLLYVEIWLDIPEFVEAEEDAEALALLEARTVLPA